MFKLWKPTQIRGHDPASRTESQGSREQLGGITATKVTDNNHSNEVTGLFPLSSPERANIEYVLHLWPLSSLDTYRTDCSIM